MTPPPTTVLSDVDIPPVLVAAAKVRAAIGKMQPDLSPGYKQRYDTVNILQKGHELGLWEYHCTVSGKPTQYEVSINGRRRTLLEDEVAPWALGVLDACQLDPGPMRYRDGL